MTPPTAPTHPTLFSRFYTWLGNLTFFHWPSLVTELVFGVLLVALLAAAVLLLHGWLALLVLATVASVLFELKLDPSGWSLKDVAQREVGILLGILIVHLVLRL